MITWFNTQAKFKEKVLNIILGMTLKLAMHSVWLCGLQTLK